MKLIVIWLIAFGITISPVAQANSYTPLGAITGMSSTVPSAYLPAKIQDRPSLPGVRPVDLELLEDALGNRKRRISIGDSRQKAQQSIIRNSLRDPVKRSHMIGTLAEARFLERNSTWGYVKSPTAPQHDVYTWLPDGKGRTYAQIKTHADGNPKTYAADMATKDTYSKRFVVPDDHVAPLREHWSRQIQEYSATGRAADAVEAKRQLDRIHPLGDTYKGLSDGLSRAAKYSLREQTAGYISLGAGAALAIGPQLWDAWQSGTVTDQTTIGMVRAASLPAVGRTTTWMLSRNTRIIASSASSNLSTAPKPGSAAIPGSLRGNAITGLAILATDTAWSGYENGGARAFHSERFYTNLGGAVSSLTAAMAVGSPTAFAVTSWTLNPIIGGTAGLVTGAAAGIAGNIGGQATTRQILEAVNPDFLRKAEDSLISETRQHLAAAINQLKVD